MSVDTYVTDRSAIVGQPRDAGLMQRDLRRDSIGRWCTLTNDARSPEDQDFYIVPATCCYAQMCGTRLFKQITP